MRDLDELRYFLGLEIDRDQFGIFMCQKKYTLDIIKEFGLSYAKPVLISMDSYIKLTANLLLMEVNQYLILQSTKDCLDRNILLI